jgi:hypothetical protein
MQVITFHGSPNNFSAFSFKKVGSNAGISGGGFGLYFSTSKADALTYGDNIYECRLQLKTNVDNHKITFTPTILKAILDKVQSEGKDYYQLYQQNATDKNKKQIISGLLASNDTDVDIIADIINSLYGGKCEEFLKILSDYGFTHTIDKESPDNETITHYIVYDLDCIKIINKEKI